MTEETKRRIWRELQDDVNRAAARANHRPQDDKAWSDLETATADLSEFCAAVWPGNC